MMRVFVVHVLHGGFFGGLWLLRLVPAVLARKCLRLHVAHPSISSSTHGLRCWVTSVRYYTCLALGFVWLQLCQPYLVKLPKRSQVLTIFFTYYADPHAKATLNHNARHSSPARKPKQPKITVWHRISVTFRKVWPRVFNLRCSCTEAAICSAGLSFCSNTLACICAATGILMALKTLPLLSTLSKYQYFLHWVWACIARGACVCV